MRIDIERPTFTATPELKKLTKAVFDGLPAEYIYSGVDADGEGYVYEIKPTLNTDIGRWLRKNSAGGLVCLGKGYDATNWQNSLIERAVESVIDWSKAPEGATHYAIKESGAIWFKDDYSFWSIWGDGEWEAIGLPASELTVLHHQAELVDDQIESENHDCAAMDLSSMERKHSHYFKDVSSVDQIDVYSVLRLFEVTDPCLQHIVKKALCAGKRGAKDFAKDVQEIADTANRLIELERGE